MTPPFAFPRGKSGLVPPASATRAVEARIMHGSRNRGLQSRAPSTRAIRERRKNEINSRSDWRNRETSQWPPRHSFAFSNAIENSKPILSSVLRVDAVNSGRAESWLFRPGRRRFTDFLYGSLPNPSNNISGLPWYIYRSPPRDPRARARASARAYAGNSLM